MLKKWSEHFTPRQCETGRDGCIRPDVYFDWMQEAASNSASSLGCGLSTLIGEGYLWVLSRIHLRTEGVIRPGDKILVETCPTGADSLFALREYRMTDENTGELRASAGSCWLLLDKEHFRPRRPGIVFPSITDGEPELPRIFPIPGKIAAEECSNPMSFPVRESMLDVNQHLNNARIAGMIFDWLSAAAGKTVQIREIQLNCNSSTPPGSVLTLSGKMDGKHFYTEAAGGIPGEKEQLRFQAEGTTA